MRSFHRQWLRLWTAVRALEAPSPPAETSGFPPLKKPTWICARPPFHRRTTNYRFSFFFFLNMVQINSFPIRSTYYLPGHLIYIIVWFLWIYLPPSRFFFFFNAAYTNSVFTCREIRTDFPIIYAVRTCDTTDGQNRRNQVRVLIIDTIY